ncbi:MAG TPA: ankyrin repeat domain-containing protein [Vicinamibacterales bacterium]|nr:ankyrin repeat domain-containing protein [Vicinamibacterales bacterium]
MSNAHLPERPSLEYLKTVAKDRLHEMRRTDGTAKLAAALLSVARDYGFSSWRALKTEVERRRSEEVARFFDACANGDVEAARDLLVNNAALARASDTRQPHGGWTALHEAAKRGHEPLVHFLLDHGADPNAREAGDWTSPLHWAAAQGHSAIVRRLLAAGGDVHGFGDVHDLDVIGWATLYRAPGEDQTQQTALRKELASLLLAQGARHHIFSAIALGDLELIRRLVEENPEQLDRRLSRFEHGMTPLHLAMSRHRHDILGLLIELGADLEATDASGRTALAVAMLHDDREAMRLLDAAGAVQPTATAPADFSTEMTRLAGSVRKAVTMIYVPDVARALDWYASMGFTELERYGADDRVNFGMVAFGQAALMLNMHGRSGLQTASLWFYTDQVDALYQLLKGRQLTAARAALAQEGEASQGIEFVQDLEDMFYGVRQFCIRDPHGYELYFVQSTP